MCPTTMEMRDVREAESFLNTMCPTTAGMGDVWERLCMFTPSLNYPISGLAFIVIQIQLFMIISGSRPVVNPSLYSLSY